MTEDEERPGGGARASEEANPVTIVPPDPGDQPATSPAIVQCSPSVSRSINGSGVVTRSPVAAIPIPPPAPVKPAPVKLNIVMWIPPTRPRSSRGRRPGHRKVAASARGTPSDDSDPGGEPPGGKDAAGPREVLRGIAAPDLRGAA